MLFRSVRTLHGQSSAADRSTTVKAWSTGELDLVIGTSAFGLGIDYPHVRAVVHACIPESLDRYYQEVGRSGRDNHASMALIAPALGDYDVAQSIARQKVISVEKGLARWGAMFARAERDTSNTRGTARFFIDTSTPPPYDMDMMGDRHEDWNGRVLSLMARAGIIAFAGLRFNLDRRRTEVAIDILDDGHGERATWNEKIEPVRKTLLATCSERLHGMQALIEGQGCPARQLVDLYALNDGSVVLPVVPACGGCAACRRNEEQGWYAVRPSPPAAPWPVGALSPRLLRHLVKGRGLFERDTESFGKTVQRRVVRELMNGFWNDGLRKCIVIGSAPEVVLNALAERPWCTAQADDSKLLSSNGLPPGPVVVWIGTGMTVPEHSFAPRAPGHECLFIVPASMPNPNRPGRLVREQFPISTFNSLYESLQT